MLQQCRLKPRQGFSVSHFGRNLIIAVEGWGRKHHSPRGDLMPNHVRSGEGTPEPHLMLQTRQVRRKDIPLPSLAWSHGSVCSRLCGLFVRDVRVIVGVDCGFPGLLGLSWCPQACHISLGIYSIKYFMSEHQQGSINLTRQRTRFFASLPLEKNVIIFQF